MVFFLFPAVAWLTAAARVFFLEGDARTGHTILEMFLLHSLVVIAGAGGFFFFSGHMFNSQRIAHGIGWRAGSPFQKEVAVANLVFGVLGILCIWFREGFWIATTIGFSVWLLGAGMVHVREMVRHGNRQPLNAGAILFFDIGIPVVLLALLIAYRLT